MHDTMIRTFEASGGLSPTDLALALDELPQTITNWSKRGISKNGALKVSTKFNVDMQWLLTGKGDKNNSKQAILQKLKREADMIMGKVDGLELVKPPIRKLPILNEVQAGLFTGMGDDSYDEFEWVHGDDGDYWLRIRGNSMEPTFEQGDLILVDTSRIADSGHYVIAKVKNKDHATFKQLRVCYDSETRQKYYELVALNTFYAPIDSRIEEFEILGVVIQHKRVLV